MPSFRSAVVTAVVTVSLATSVANAQLAGNNGIAAPSHATTETKKSLRLDQKSAEPLALAAGEFSQEEDWLKTLALTVKNTSTKNVVYAEYELVLHGVRNTAGMPITLPVYYGDSDLVKGDMPLSEAKAVKPDKTAKLSVSSKDYKKLLEDLKAVHAKPPVQATLRLRTVCFADGTAWRDGHAATVQQLRSQG
jgi:hypothetical protein